ncbi:hypothetical protein A5883_003628, partial [Enterococcus sp. 5B3_DIV0040]
QQMIINRKELQQKMVRFMSSFV